MANEAECVNVPVSALAALAVEYWRLGNWLNGSGVSEAGPARHAIRKMGDFLHGLEIEVQAMDALRAKHQVGERQPKQRQHFRPRPVVTDGAEIRRRNAGRLRFAARNIHAAPCYSIFG